MSLRVARRRCSSALSDFTLNKTCLADRALRQTDNHDIGGANGFFDLFQPVCPGKMFLVRPDLDFRWRADVGGVHEHPAYLQRSGKEMRATDRTERGGVIHDSSFCIP